MMIKETGFIDLYPITEDHFLKFREYVTLVAGDVGLHDWEIHVQTFKDDSKEIPDFRACCTADYTDHLACIWLADRLDVEPTDYWLARTAFHECWEIMFNEIENNMKGSVNYKRGLVHSIIRTIETAYFESWLCDNEIISDDDTDDDDDET